MSPAEIGKYRLVRRLAQGGMAEVFLARQIGPAGFNKQVVIKRVLPNREADEEHVRLFLDEARIAARLAHPNIVQVFDFGEENGAYFLAMEYLEGLDLATVLAALRERGRPMPWLVAALVASAACEALSYAHTRRSEDGRPLNIIHRDISPSNLFLTYHGAVKVLDFGIALSADKLARTETGAIRGKCLYMSPEQVRGEPLDARSDLFALGAVLHECLVGRPLFQRPSVPAIFHAVLQDPVPRPSECGAEAPRALEDVAMRALERAPFARWRGAREMREALDACLEAAAPGSAATQLAKFLEELEGASPEEGSTPGLKPSTVPMRLLPQEVAGAPGSPRTQADRAPQVGSDAFEAPLGTCVERLAAGGASRHPPPEPGAAALNSKGPSTLPRAQSSGRMEQALEAMGPALDSKRAAKSGAWAWGAVLVAGAGVVAALSARLPMFARNEPNPEARADSAPAPPPSSTTPSAASAPTPTPTPTLEAARGNVAAPAPRPTRSAPAAAPRAPHAPVRLVAEALRTAPSEPAPGAFDVNCVPWCQIAIDGVDTGRHSPARGIPAKPGTHEVRLVNPRSQLEKVLTIEIQVGRDHVRRPRSTSRSDARAVEKVSCVNRPARPAQPAAAPRR